MDYQLTFVDLWPYRKQFIDGLLLTIAITIVTTAFGIVVGIIGASARSFGNKALKVAFGVYVEVIRNTPFIVQLFFIFFGLPAIGIEMNAWQAGILTMVINLGAYNTEIIRAGVDATPKGQLEASRCLGLSTTQAFIRIILPQALKKIYPALTSQAIIVMLGSAVLSQISVEELTFAANFVQSRTFRSFESYLLIAIIYLLLSLGLRQAFNLVFYYAFPCRRSKNVRD